MVEIEKRLQESCKKYINAIEKSKIKEKEKLAAAVAHILEKKQEKLDFEKLVPLFERYRSLEDKKEAIFKKLKEEYDEKLHETHTHLSNEYLLLSLLLEKLPKEIKEKAKRVEIKKKEEVIPIIFQKLEVEKKAEVEEKKKSVEEKKEELAKEEKKLEEKKEEKKVEETKKKEESKEEKKKETGGAEHEKIVKFAKVLAFFIVLILLVVAISSSFFR
ncbi:MAG: hypothetical protein QW735_02810 [archaeon]